MKRLDPEDLGIFGIEFDRSPVAKTVWNPIRRAWEGLDLSPADADLVAKAKRSQGNALTRGLAKIGLTPRQAVIGAGGLTVGIILGALARGKANAPEPAAPPPPPAPPPPSGTGKPLTAPGGTLTVHTPRPKQPGTLRPSPSLKTRPLGYLQPGTVVKVLDSATGNDGATWYKIQPPTGPAGWMHGDILA